MKHTPTPWKVTSGCVRFYIESPKGYVIAHTFDSDHIPMPQRRINADFIVKAVNNHDALFQSLQLAIAGLEKLVPLTGHESDVLNLKQARKALAQAK